MCTLFAAEEGQPDTVAEIPVIPLAAAWKTRSHQGC